MKLDVVPIPSPGRAATRVRRRQGGPRKLVVGLSVDVTTVLLCTQGRPSTNSRRWFCRADCDVHCHAAGQARLPGPKLTQGMANVRPEAAVESSPPHIGPLLLRYLGCYRDRIVGLSHVLGVGKRFSREDRWQRTLLWRRG